MSGGGGESLLASPAVSPLQAGCLLRLRAPRSAAIRFLSVVAETPLSAFGEVGRAASESYFPGELRNRGASGFECFRGSVKED